MRIIPKCKFHPFAAERAEREGRYEDAIELYKLAIINADTLADKEMYQDSIDFCKSLIP